MSVQKSFTNKVDYKTKKEKMVEKEKGFERKVA